MGRPEMAAHFRDTQRIPFPLLVDRERQTYRALELARGSRMDVMGPAVWGRFAKGIVTGKGLGIPKQDPLQLSGMVVADTGGEILFVYRSKTSADNAPVRDLLDALPEPAQSP